MNKKTSGFRLQASGKEEKDFRLQASGKEEERGFRLPTSDF
jgi:hypothetical protein